MAFLNTLYNGYQNLNLLNSLQIAELPSFSLFYSACQKWKRFSGSDLKKQTFIYLQMMNHWKQPLLKAVMWDLINMTQI
ncbi:unnamed protein product [Paramecium octaurelia]|uniref:Uncharacterized protein n=1 Tax=Paramecium octaurelia TaxID=43137 RepID=A0A8S1XD54_PAROT|nr:unnamed protein product [Paramecium octaurelia]